MSADCTLRDKKKQWLQKPANKCGALFGRLPLCIGILTVEVLMLVVCAISGMLVFDFYIIKTIRQLYNEDKNYLLLGLIIPQYFLLAILFILWSPFFWVFRIFVMVFGGKERRAQLKEDLSNPEEGDMFYLVWPIMFQFALTLASVLRIPCAIALLPCALLTRFATYIIYIPWRQRVAKYFHVWPKKAIVFFATHERFEWLYDTENGLGVRMHERRSGIALGSHGYLLQSNRYRQGQASTGAIPLEWQPAATIAEPGCRVKTLKCVTIFRFPQVYDHHG